MHWQLVLVGITMGLAFAAPPGIVTAETLRRGMRGGFVHAFSVQVGSLIGDASYALLALAGLAAILQQPLAQAVVGALGAVFMLYLAWQSFQTQAAVQLASSRDGSYREAFVSGMLLSLSNPWAIAFWVSLGSSFVALGFKSAGEMPWLFASFMLGSLIWAIVLAGLIDRARHLLSPKLFRLVSISCGVLLVVFAVDVAAHIFSTLLA